MAFKIKWHNTSKWKILLITLCGIIGEKRQIDLPKTTSNKFRLLITKLKKDITKYGVGQTDPSLVEVELYNKH